ncbi:MAG: hypothetical protein R2711_03265 [Acidimicrobiales bacterium]
MVDALLRSTGVFAAHQAVVDRVMDSNDQEREAGHHHPRQGRLGAVGRHQDQPGRHPGPRRLRR